MTEERIESEPSGLFLQAFETRNLKDPHYRDDNENQRPYAHDRSPPHKVRALVSRDLTKATGEANPSSDDHSEAKGAVARVGVNSSSLGVGPQRMHHAVSCVHLPCGKCKDNSTAFS